MGESIKTCPFCNSEKVYDFGAFNNWKKCKSCGAMIKEQIGKIKEK